jgi:hypothetical protein
MSFASKSPQDESWVQVRWKHIEHSVKPGKKIVVDTITSDWLALPI